MGKVSLVLWLVAFRESIDDRYLRDELSQWNTLEHMRSRCLNKLDLISTSSPSM